MILTRFSINWDSVRAISQFMSRDEIRYILNGVLFEQKGGSVVLCATDSRVLGAFKTPVEPRKECSGKLLKFIVPATLITRIKVPKGSFVDVSLELRDGKTLVRVESRDGFSIQSPTIEGIFPNWRQVVPLHAVVHQVSACFRASHIAMFEKARALISPDHNAIRMWQQPNSPETPLFMDIGNKDFTGVMMPVRIHGEEITFTTRSYINNPET